MKKKIANSIEAALIIASYIMLWLPVLSLQYTKLKRPMPVATSVMKLTPKGTVYIITIIFIINVLMCLFSILEKKGYRDGKIHIFMPIVLFLYMASANQFKVGKIVEEWTVVENRFPSFLWLICMSSAIAISILKRSPLIVGFPKVEVKNSSQSTDELKKYKDLLDNNIITQEEFEQKKKQLLGL